MRSVSKIKNELYGQQIETDEMTHNNDDLLKGAHFFLYKPRVAIKMPKMRLKFAL